MRNFTKHRIVMFLIFLIVIENTAFSLSEMMMCL